MGRDNTHHTRFSTNFIRDVTESQHADHGASESDTGQRCAVVRGEGVFAIKSF